MNVLIIVDKIGSAIWRLAEAVRVGNPHLNIRVFPVHPKRNSPEELFEAQDLLNWCDVVDIHYWKSGEVLKTSFPTEFAAKPRILFHFNPYDLDKQNWTESYDMTVVGNVHMHETIPYSRYIPYAVDLSKFSYIDDEDYTQEKVVHMSVNRIESKKGVAEVAQACYELKYKLLLIGRVSEPAYVHEIMAKYSDVVEFRESVDEQGLIDSYNEAAVHVCNSTDGFESGTLPVLEAMARGVPVLARNVGHVPDLFDGANMVVREGEKGNIEDLKARLQELMENRDWRLKMRQKAWETVKTRDSRRMAWDIAKLYYELWEGERPLVSVIIPTYNRPEALVECLVAVAAQDYKKMEIIVVNSGKLDVSPIIEGFRKQAKMPLKYIEFEQDGYTLAQARNRAVIEAQGQFLVFCDERIAMEPTAVSKFAEAQIDNVWQWGIKDGAEKGFVENFSCVKREDVIKYGMFCERIDWYGGMSQDIRERFEKRNGMVFDLNKQAQAKSTMRTQSKKHRRRDIIEAKLMIYKMYP